METSFELDCMTGRNRIRSLMRLRDFLFSMFQGSFCPRFMRVSVPKVDSKDKSESMNQNDLDKKYNGMTQQDR